MRFFLNLKSLFSFKCVWWISYWWVLYCNVFKWSLIFIRTEDDEKYIIHGKLILILHPNYLKSTKTEIHTNPPIIWNLLIMLVFLSKHLKTTIQWWYVHVSLNPCAPFWTFLSILVFLYIYIIMPVFMLTAYILAQVCIFIGILIFHPHFL